MDFEVIKLSSKGQMTLPKSIRDRLQLEKGSHLVIYLKGEKIILKRVKEITLLSEQDPIWQMVGLCQEDKDGVTDLADNHDRYLAEGETGSWEKPWRKV